MIQSSIRFASELDAEAIALVHIRSWQKAYEQYIPESILSTLSLADRTQQWAELLREGVKVLVLEADKHMVGFASVCSFREDDKPNKLAGEISAIFLDPNYWRAGLGSTLCLAAMEELVRLGYQAVFLWVMSDNSQARLFYEKLGFQVTSRKRLEAFYEGGALLSELLYKKELN